ncbi:vWA domain-containing protein [Celerinatantimonas sp. YJH-8]|uniref:vWA domain-containing protein n=1 Tax=Celerinatantimonas sp. YJH-8 TaxID=3228714 RepID=UPI0038C4CF31
MNLTFAWWPILVLIPLPWLMRFIKRKEQPTTAPLINQSLPYLLVAPNESQKARSSFTLWLIWGLLLIAAARPQWLDDATTPIERQGRNLMLAVDLSGSMQIPDMQWNGDAVSRLVALRHLLAQFIEHRRGDRIGMILFADHAYLQAPLTFDTQTVQHYAEQMNQGLVGNKTAIGEAIGLGVKQLLKQPAKQRVLILLTDGQNTAGLIQPKDAAKIAKENGVTIYTIGIGSRAFERRTIFGIQRINPSQDLDEPLLKEIAHMTGGQYFRAASSAQLAAIYQQLDKLVPIKGPQQFYRPKTELYFIPLAVALGWLLIVPLLRFIPVQRRRT